MNRLAPVIVARMSTSVVAGLTPGTVTCQNALIRPAPSLAALQNVPKELYESAATDGAGRVKAFWHVTVPGVRAATTLVLILATITGANLFTEPYLLTNGGGPNGASTSPVLVMYQKGIEQGNPDTAAAIGVLLVIGVLLLSLGSKKLLERD